MGNDSGLVLRHESIVNPQLPGQEEQHDDTGRDERFAQNAKRAQESLSNHSAQVYRADSRRPEPSLCAWLYLSIMAKTKKLEPKAARKSKSNAEGEAPNPVWFKPVMFGFMLLGLAWIIVFYISQASLPVAALGQWNILVGFGIAFIGFLMTTRWR